MKYVLILSFFLLAACGRKKDNPPAAPPDDRDVIETEKPTTEEEDLITLQWFEEQEVVYKEKVENDLGKFEQVEILRDDRQVRFTFFRDVSKPLPFLKSGANQLTTGISESTFCTFELSGPVIKIDIENKVQFHTEHITRRMDFTADRIDKVDPADGSDRANCALFKKNVSDSLPLDIENLDFYYNFVIPKENVVLEKGVGEYLDPLFSFIQLMSSHQGEMEDWDMELELNSTGGNDYFNGLPSTGGDDYAEIFDLGDRSCRNVGRRTKKRFLDPVRWLNDAQRNHPDFIDVFSDYRAIVRTGHCYLLKSGDSDSHFFAMFRVRNHLQGKKVILHEVEVLHILGN